MQTVASNGALGSEKFFLSLFGSCVTTFFLYLLSRACPMDFDVGAAIKRRADKEKGTNVSFSSLARSFSDNAINIRHIFLPFAWARARRNENYG